MRMTLIALTGLAACTGEANHLGNPLLLPLSGVSTATQNVAYAQRRGQVEVIVKSNYAAILDDIDAGGGPTLTEAMDASGVPQGDRPARVIQMQGDLGLYTQSPEALVVALMVYSN